MRAKHPGDEALIKYLNARNKDLKTPLHIAGSIGFVTPTKTLIKHGAVIDITNLELLSKITATLMRSRDYAKTISELITVSDSLKTHILYMLNNILISSSLRGDEIIKAKDLYAILLDSNPELIAQAAKTHSISELKKIQTTYPDAMKKAFDWAIEHDEEGALSMVPYLPGVPEHYASEYGYDKLKCAIASGLPASVLFVDKKTDIFMKNSDLAPIEILSMQDANYVLHILYAGLGIGTKEYNKAILRDLYNGNLLNTARIFIINNVISLDGCGEYCGNILTQALCDGKLEWVDMLLESGFSKYSASGLTAELWNGVSAPNYLITEKNFKEVEDYLEYIGKIACLMEESAWNIRNWEATQDIVYGDKAIPKSFIQSLGEEIAYSHAKTQNGFAEKCLYTIHQALELRWEENFANQIMNKLNAETHNYHLFLDAPDKLLQEVSIASLAVVEKNPKTIEDYAEYLGKLAYILDKDIWDTLGWEVVQHPQYPGSLTAPSFIQALINRIVISDKKMNEEFAHKCLSAIYEALELRWGRNFANEKMNEFWQAIELSWKMGFANETDILTEQAGEMFEAAAVAQDENASHGDKFWHNIGDISMEDLLMGNSAISVAC